MRFICPTINGTFMVQVIKKNAGMQMFYMLFAFVRIFIVIIKHFNKGD